MGVPGSANALLLTSAAAGGYKISRSVRLNAPDSAYLSRTPAVAGSRTTWTWSGWIKRAKLGSFQHLFVASDFTSTTTLAILNSDDTIEFYDYQSGGYTTRLVTTQVFRDPGAWQHLQFTWDSNNGTSTDRMRIYVNGTRITTFSTATYPSPGVQTRWNNNVDHRIGTGNSTQYLDSYLAECYLIDGQALTPSSFTEVSATTGQLIPIAYTGSYGTNGFHLPFSDNSTAAALGTDTSGNSNTWTVNNISVTAGAGNDSLVDTPTSYGTPDTGVGNEVRGNYCTWNPLDNAGLVLLNGNLQTNNTVSAYYSCRGTIKLPSTGKWYFETTTGNPVGAAVRLGVGTAGGSTEYFVGVDTNQLFTIHPGGARTYSTSITGANSLLAVAYDADTQKLWFGFNNSWLDGSTGLTGNPAAGTNPTYTSISDVFPTASQYSASNVNANFGARAFSYTAPSGFKALCDTNLPEPTIADGSTVMDVVLYTGNTPSSQTITQLNFSPDFVWLKVRNAGDYHQLYDAVRGATNYLHSNTTGAEATDANALTAFTSTGFSVGSTGGVNSGSMVAWAWDAGTSTVSNTAGSITSQVRANASAGFSVVSVPGYTYPTKTAGHGLGVEPHFIITKNRGASNPWIIYHKSAGANTYFQFDTGAGYAGVAGVWSGVTSTVFPLNSGVNQQTDIVAYCFAPVAGYSSFGSYTGNGSADGPFVFCNFRPRWIMFKCSSTNNGYTFWEIVDTARPNNLAADLYDAEGSYNLGTGLGVDILSNGFKVRGTGSGKNLSSQTYIYAAFAESPLQYARAR
jgi:hypothetical protein